MYLKTVRTCVCTAFSLALYFSMGVTFSWAEDGEHKKEEWLRSAAPSLSGELKKWHKITLNFEGPEVSEQDDYNPFVNYRFNVAFHHTQTGRTLLVPGHFAADGHAAESSAEKGKIWRVHFAADAVGEWTWSAQFRKGRFVAVSTMPFAGSPAGYMDGLTGRFNVSESDKKGRDFRAHGRLQYVGEHYPKFMGSDHYFLKQGPDAPENLLSYADFDGTFHTDGHKDQLVKTWSAHEQDATRADPTWQQGKGKALLGALNYISGKGMNSISMLLMNIEGDDQNVFPFTDYDHHDRYDVSKLEQWELVFGHAQKLGLMLHFKLMEMENQGLLDNGAVGLRTMVYYREMTSRFGHHLALIWNLGEENGEWVPNHPTVPMNTAQRHAMVEWFTHNDPYQHITVMHNGLPQNDMLGTHLAGIAIQGENAKSNQLVQQGRNLSRAAGHHWLVAHDEQGPANNALPPDDIEPDHVRSREGALWGGLLGGSWGSEWYFGYNNPHSDLTAQDWRTRDKFWDQARYALEFFNGNNIPFWQMQPANELLSNRNAYCFALPGDTYVIYLQHATEHTQLDLGRSPGLYTGLGNERYKGAYDIHWFNPRQGGKLQKGSVSQLINDGKPSETADGVNDLSRYDVGQPPSDSEQDWVVLIRKK